MATQDLGCSFGVFVYMRGRYSEPLSSKLKLKQWYWYNKVGWFATRLFMGDEKETECGRGLGGRYSLLDQNSVA